MKNIDFFYINKLSILHNNKDIFFCKTDYLLKDFETILKLDNEVILITGNSDYAITDDIVNRAPKNIKKWYCQNALSNKDIVHPIPIGLENREFCTRSGHGIGYGQRVAEKEQAINIDDNIHPEKFIYANFNISTNIHYRQIIKNTIDDISYIDWHDPDLDTQTFFKNLRQYKMVLCPIGNGIDTHRLWETLYCGRIPITIRIDKYKIYSMYEKLPIIVLDNVSDLYNYTLINNKYNNVLNTQYDMSLLNSSYWIDTIRNASISLNKP